MRKPISPTVEISRYLTCSAMVSSSIDLPMRFGSWITCPRGTSRAAKGSVHARRTPCAPRLAPVKMRLMAAFVSCPSCGCAAKVFEVACPHCGVRLRSSDGTIAKTAVVAMLGLVAGCSAPAPAPKYGVPATDGDVVSVPAPEPAPPAEPTSEPSPEPSVPPTSTQAPRDDGPAVAPLYGVPGTPGD